jgi:hypothetical protein
VLAGAYAVGQEAEKVCGSATIELERLAAIQALRRYPVRLKPDTAIDT